MKFIIFVSLLLLWQTVFRLPFYFYRLALVWVHCVWPNSMRAHQPSRSNPFGACRVLVLPSRWPVPFICKLCTNTTPPAVHGVAGFTMARLHDHLLCRDESASKLSTCMLHSMNRSDVFCFFFVVVVLPKQIGSTMHSAANISRTFNRLRCLAPRKLYRSWRKLLFSP